MASKHANQAFECPYCGETVPRTRVDQTTCGATKCQGQDRRGVGELPLDGSENQVYQRKIKALRQFHGLRELKPGRIPCCSCLRLFDSWDTTLNQLCDECKNPKEDI